MVKNSCTHGYGNCGWDSQEDCPRYEVSGDVLLRRTSVYVLILSALLAFVLCVCF